MFNTINIYHLLSQTLIKDSTEYKFNKLENSYLILCPKDNENKAEIYISFRRLIKSNDWYFSKDCDISIGKVLEIDLNHLKGLIRSHQFNRLKKELESHSDPMDHFKKHLKKSLKYDTTIQLFTHDYLLSSIIEKNPHELIQLIEDDLTFVRDELASKSEDSDIHIKKINKKNHYTEFSNIKSFNSIQFENDDFYYLLKKAYRRQQAKLQTFDEDYIFFFLRLMIEEYIINHLELSSDQSNKVKNNLYIDICEIQDKNIVPIKLIDSYSPSYGIADDSPYQLVYFIINNKETILLCKIVLTKQLFFKKKQTRILFKKPYLMYIPDIKYGMEKFLNQFYIFNTEKYNTKIKELILGKKNDINKFMKIIEYLSTNKSDINISIWKLIYNLSNQDWDLILLLNTLIQFYLDDPNNRILKNQIIRDSVLTDLISILNGLKQNQRYLTKKMKTQSYFPDLKKTVKNLKFLVDHLVNIATDQPNNWINRLIKILFDILTQLFTLTSREDTNFKELNSLRMNRVPIYDKEFIDLAFELFENVA
jgi:hypothetical protein